MKKQLLFLTALMSVLSLHAAERNMHAQTASYDTISCQEAYNIAMTLSDGESTTKKYVVVGYISNVVGSVSNNQQSFWMSDTKGGTNTFYSYYANIPSGVTFAKDMYVASFGIIKRYSSKPEQKNATITVLTEPQKDTVPIQYDTIHVPVAGTFGQIILQKFEQWTDAKHLIITGSLNETDITYFSRLTNLQYVDLSQTDILSIAGFSNLTLLKTVVLPSTVTLVKQKAFYGCASLQSINLPNVTTIEESAFYGCSSLKTITLPNVEVIGASAFYECNSLYGIDMPKVQSLGYSCFCGCASLLTINLPKVQYLDEKCFYCCSSLLTINLPKVQSLGEECFYNCYTLKEVDLSNVTEWGSSCFKGCSKLSKVTFSDNLTYIPYRCFYNCTSLKSVNLPKNLKSIGDGAFYKCPLTTITLPSALKSIGDYAFSTVVRSENYTTGQYDTLSIMTDIYSYIVVPITTNGFDGDVSQTTLHVPAMSVSAYRLHDSWYAFGKVVPLDELISSIDINTNYSLLSQEGLNTQFDLALNAGNLLIQTGKALTMGTYTQNLYATLLNYDDISANTVSQTFIFYPNRWYFISFPFDVKISDIVVPEETLWVIRKYSGADRAAMTGNTWQNMSDGSVLKAGEGYILQCANASSSSSYIQFTFKASDNTNKNNIFTHQNVSKSLSAYPADLAHNRGWNLIGNPYPCYYQTQKMNHNGVITVWNGRGYSAYSLLDDDYYLCPNEAFFVQCAKDGDAVTFDVSGRSQEYVGTLNSSDYYYAPQRTVEDNPARAIYNLSLSCDGYSDHTRFVINEQASMDYEISCDASKFMSTQLDVPQIYTLHNSQKLAINERPDASEPIQVGAYFGKDDTYTITLSGSYSSDIHPILTDNETKVTVDLALNTYTFSAQKGTADARFSISLHNISTDCHAISHNILTEGDIYTLNGGYVKHLSSRSQLNNLPAGCYLLRFNGQCEKVVVK